jgi:hypothetical protein
VGSSEKTRRRHQAENTLLASVRDAKGISGSKVGCLRLSVAGYIIFQGSWRVSEQSMPRRRCLSRSYNVTKEVSMPYPKSQIQIRYARERERPVSIGNVQVVLIYLPDPLRKTPPVASIRHRIQEKKMVAPTFVQSKPTENMRPVCPPTRSVTWCPVLRSHTLTPKS